MAGVRVARDRRRRDPADRRGPRRRAARASSRRGARARHGGARRGARRARARTRTRACGRRSSASTTATCAPSRCRSRRRSAMLPRVPAGRLVVTESGILVPADVRRMRAAGVHAFLVGEAFMRADDPGAALARPGRVKASKLDAGCRSPPSATPVCDHSLKWSSPRPDSRRGLVWARKGARRLDRCAFAELPSGAPHSPPSLAATSIGSSWPKAIDARQQPTSPPGGRSVLRREACYSPGSSRRGARVVKGGRL